MCFALFYRGMKIVRSSVLQRSPRNFQLEYGEIPNGKFEEFLLLCYSSERPREKHLWKVLLKVSPENCAFECQSGLSRGPITHVCDCLLKNLGGCRASWVYHCYTERIKPTCRVISTKHSLLCRL